MREEKVERYRFEAKAYWTLFAQSGTKTGGTLEDISRKGLSFKTSKLIEHRRWIRLIIEDDSSNLYFTIVGRVIEIQPLTRIRKFRYKVEFTFPNYFSLSTNQAISALSRRNLTVASCRKRNSSSRMRPEFLA